MVELTMTDKELKQFIFTNYNERYVARPKLIDEELWARYKVSYIWKKTHWAYYDRNFTEDVLTFLRGEL